MILEEPTDVTSQVVKSTKQSLLLCLNVAIVVILLNKKSLHDPQEPRYKNAILAPEGYLEKLPCRLQNSDTNCVPR